ncbi:hypothetical protein, partial [Synechococcus sp. 8F6]|uniref:hypothetical protein n=1 Tax=Synechococcus sp. 8F6 TaxID=2025606 RepID=UPI001E31DC94
ELVPRRSALALLNCGCHENERRVFQRNGYGRRKFDLPKGQKRKQPDGIPSLATVTEDCGDGERAAAWMPQGC